MSDVGEQAMATARAFIDAFNAQDHERHADTLNYPHVRLAKGAFETIPTREDCVARSRHGEASRWRRRAGITPSSRRSRSCTRAPARCTSRSRTIAVTPTGPSTSRSIRFWIVTLQDGHWGVQFRSSYLR